MGGSVEDRATDSATATFDVYLNDRGVLAQRAVQRVELQALAGIPGAGKKWLSYRESKVLGRPLKPDEVQHFAEVGRRVGAILSGSCPEPGGVARREPVAEDAMQR